VERLAGQAQVRGIGGDNGDAVTEPGAQLGSALWVALDRDDGRAGVDERPGDGTEAGADVEHEVAAPDTRISDEPLRPPLIELMPAPVPA